MSELEKAVTRSATVVLDGKPRELIFGLEAMAAIESQTGQSPFETDIMSRLLRPSAVGLRTLLWAGLAYERPPPDIQAVSNLVTLSEVKTLFQAVFTAFADQSPEPKEEETAPADPQTAGG